jgi:hypothetical protein
MALQDMRANMITHVTLRHHGTAYKALLLSFDFCI